MLAVGSLKPNDLGLFDMLGNVMEYTADAIDPYSLGDGGDPDEATERDINDAIGRVSRGGAFLSFGMNVRCAFRNWGRPSYPSLIVGFRPARTFR
jgi:formylglycine-generating enzyme required for sulfatase activity